MDPDAPPLPSAVLANKSGSACLPARLQSQELGLPVDPDAPLLGFIGRLDAQKGVDLIADNYEWLMEQVGGSHS